ncbi:putative Zn-binding protein involved in type VI secretion [Duganella sp. 1224]|uniref:PAAR domain-containing protein n=1 Tax=Duganella sp. 1224 TaxID=2587052 RepID=UPI0015CBBDF3|nr:PAAR domain-containing protein [Duganella sp. 1224]NYE61775.1 putative Zn-binding protein involved in type VI secretion [Duganella sp. 1224]
MQRYHITLGASTSTGGKVISASSCCSIDGVLVALEGDAIFCPACKSPGKIKIFGPRIPESWNGTQVALQDDLCICKCAPPPKLIANQQRKYQVVDGSAPSSSAATQTASAAREEAQAAALGDQDEQITLRLLDDLTQAPLAARRYRFELAGKTIEGVTDSSGYTQPISAAERAQLVAWHLLD